MNRTRLMKLGIVIIIAALAGAAAFLFVTKDQLETSQDSADLRTYELLQGDWQIVFTDQVPTAGETISFQEHDMTFCRNGEILWNGEWQIRNSRITAQDESFEYIVEVATEDCVKLISADSSSTLSLIPAAVMEGAFDGSLLVGEWNVLVHGNSLTKQEKIQFTEEDLTLYKDSKVYIESDYVFEDGVLNVKQNSLTLKIIPLSENDLIMLDEDGGYVWQIQKQ